MSVKASYKAIGMMSGTSLDGLDLACCRFVKKRKWEFEIQFAKTISYDRSWKDKLANSHRLTGEELAMLHSGYGAFIGECCRDFISANKIRNIDLLASHGHTVFHQPHRGFTFQLGSGNSIHALTGLPVAFDFRSLDVSLGGQGAPLVPVGDRYLFGEFDVCLNLGGIANLSMESSRQRLAFDICYANMGLNYLAQKKGLEFDRDGKLASRGTVDRDLLDMINATYKVFRRSRPSLGREGFELNLLPLLDNAALSVEDRMTTFCQSIVDEVRIGIPPLSKKRIKLLVTGGGALNPVLMEMLAKSLRNISAIVIPPRNIVEFKEALVFAFLGVLRIRGEVNVLKSVTHASRDSCSGAIIGNI